jgi:hypothetical protein
MLIVGIKAVLLAHRLKSKNSDLLCFSEKRGHVVLRILERRGLWKGDQNGIFKIKILNILFTSGDVVWGNRSIV